MRKRLTDRFLMTLSGLIGVALLLGAAPHGYADSTQMTGRSVKLSSSRAGIVATHDVRMTLQNFSQPVGSIRLMYCANSPIIGDSCTAPIGLNLGAVQLSQQSGETGFSIAAGSPSNEIILTRPAVLPTAHPSEYVLGNIVNPTSSGSYYIRLETFTSTDATGLNIESGGVVFAIVDGLSISTEVPPYLTFCAAVTISGLDCSSATSYLIDLGELNTSKSVTASSQVMIATNAANGYSVLLNGTTLTSGNNTIPAIHPAGVSLTGTNQFGLNLRANSNPSVGGEPSGPGSGGVIDTTYGTPNVFNFRNGDPIVISTTTSDKQLYTLSYVVNISPTQPAGYYATTLTYICLANF